MKRIRIKNPIRSTYKLNIKTIVLAKKASSNKDVDWLFDDLTRQKRNLSPNNAESQSERALCRLRS